MRSPESIFNTIAYNNSVSVDEVKLQIENTALVGMRNPDPNIRFFWNQIPRKGNTPTAEEIVTHLADIAVRINILS